MLSTTLRRHQLLGHLRSIDICWPKESLARLGIFIGLLNYFLVLIKFKFLDRIDVLVEHLTRGLNREANVRRIFFFYRGIATQIVLIFFLSINITLVYLNTAPIFLKKSVIKFLSQILNFLLQFYVYINLLL